MQRRDVAKLQTVRKILDNCTERGKEYDTECYETHLRKIGEDQHSGTLFFKGSVRQGRGKKFS